MNRYIKLPGHSKYLIIISPEKGKNQADSPWEKVGRLGTGPLQLSPWPLDPQEVQASVTGLVGVRMVLCPLGREGQRDQKANECKSGSTGCSGGGMKREGPAIRCWGDGTEVGSPSALPGHLPRH